jgi:hypothetical protein
VQKKWDAATILQARETLRLVEAAHATSQALQDKASEQRKATNDQINRINRAHALALERLRNRPERPSGADLPQVASAGPIASGCTGAGLYRDDGGFLAGYAADKALLQSGLRACYKAYSDAEEALK